MAQFNYQALTQPVLPQPPAPNTLDKWQVERLPYVVQPLGNSWAIAGVLMAEVRELLPLPPPAVSVTFAGAIQQTYYLTVPYFNPTLSAAAALMALGSPMDGLNEEHVTLDKYTAHWAYPYPQPSNVAARALAGVVGPIRITPFVPAPATTGFLPSNVPYEALFTYKKDFVAIDTEEGSYHVLQFIPVTVDKYSVNNYAILIGRAPNYSAVIAAHNQAVAPIFPTTAAVLTGPLGAWWQQVWPQWQPQSPLTALANIQTLTQPILPQPFVPATVTGLPWWQQETWQRWTANRFDWERLYTGSVSNILPIPFVPPPPVPRVCTPPPGFDADTSVSYFRNASGPVAVLFCRICQSTKPLLVRGDYAIWCTDCCSFVSKQDTVMGTLRAPGTFKNVF